jgi:hypothetical protein
MAEYRNLTDAQVEKITKKAKGDTEKLLQFADMFQLFAKMRSTHIQDIKFYAMNMDVSDRDVEGYAKSLIDAGILRDHRGKWQWVD